MIGLNVLFWIFVVLFALIGLTRGWAKELLVSFSVILGIFIISVSERFVPYIQDILSTDPGTSLFWTRSGILAALVFFGYQSPNIARLASTNRFVREQLQDSLLGLFLGALNGYLIFGTFWYFLQDAGYPFPIIIPPQPGTPIGDAVERLIIILPPHWLGSPTIYFAVAIAFAFILVVFI